MAVLSDGVYDLGNSSVKKTVIFVKLTDSALRAIEDYVREQQKTRQHATLQFLGNEGRIHVPSSHANDGHSFDFSLSSNVDIEGPQGSFECIQQCGGAERRSLESLGTLPFKLRIHAKDDVYDLTRQRINLVEDKRKQDCAKEIKHPNTDNGRKVKKKGGVNQPLLPHRREPSPISNNYSNSKSSLLSNNTSSKLSNGYINNGSNYYSSGNHQSNNYKTNNGLNTNDSSSKIVNMNMKLRTRPIRERIIHMLALKPLKKPELFAKIYKDGVKDKEKKMLMHVLQQVSQSKDNVHNLRRGIWNDVMEDWPFYTEEERQIMKRRKPQNLTPPGSDCSVGSVGSGTSSSSSPRSTTSGSGISPTSYPPTMSHNNFPGNNHLNNNNNQYNAGQPPTKSSSNYSSSHNSNSNIGSSLPGQVTLPLQPSQGVKRPGFFDNNNNSGGMGGSSGGIGGGQEVSDNIPSKKSRVSHFKRPNCSSSNGSNNSANNNIRVENRERDSPKSNYNSRDSPKSKDSPNSNREMPPIQQQRSGNSHSSSMGNGHNQDRLSPTGNGLAPHISNHNNHKFHCGLQSDNIIDYFYNDYTTIRTPEQRNRYRAAFNAEYTEYRDLHSVIDKVSKKFAQLEERLRREDKGSEGYQVVRDQIISEYNYNKNSKEYIDARTKFTYMHEKLSHIKRLVLAYDTAHSSNGSGGPECDDDF